MGQTYQLSCPSCGYKKEVRFGMGFTLNVNYRLDKHDKAQIMSGIMGQNLKRFYLADPDAVARAEYKIYQCNDCKRIWSGLTITLFKDEESAKTEYQCFYCHSSAHILPDDEEALENMACPVCGKAPLRAEISMFWD